MIGVPRFRRCPCSTAFRLTKDSNSSCRSRRVPPNDATCHIANNDRFLLLTDSLPFLPYQALHLCVMPNRKGGKTHCEACRRHHPLPVALKALGRKQGRNGMPEIEVGLTVRRHRLSVVFSCSWTESEVQPVNGSKKSGDHNIHS